MKAVTFTSRRSFSLDSVQTVPLVAESDLVMDLLCFEAGQKTEEFRNNGTTVYQVIEGEVIVRSGDGREQAGAGRLLSVATGVPHTAENAGGGLLTLLVTRRPAEQ